MKTIEEIKTELKSAQSLMIYRDQNNDTKSIINMILRDTAKKLQTKDVNEAIMAVYAEFESQNGRTGNLATFLDFKAEKISGVNLF